MSGEPAQLLAWDTEHWGRAIARVRPGPFDAALAAQLDLWHPEHPPELLSYLCDAADGASLVAAQAAGFRVVDVRLELACDELVSAPSPPSDLAVRDVAAPDVLHLRAIAREAHGNTRFAIDASLRPRAGALYERWVERDVASGAPAVVAVIDGAVAGYCTTQVDASTGAISLLAVSGAARRRGAGAALVRSALARLSDLGCERATVVTSASAVAAQRLYQRLGFRTTGTGLWLHRWRVGTGSTE